MSNQDQLFPAGYIGLMAQKVDPNPKCQGCLHYDPQRGGDGGVCTIGLRPFTCGTGEHPRMGYAPLTGLVADFAAHTFPAQARTPGADNNLRIAIQARTLGEEHVEMVKSGAARLGQLYKCRACSLGKALTTTTNVETMRLGACTCPPVSERSLVKSVMESLNNRQSWVLGDHAEAYVTSLVQTVRRGVTDIEAVRKSLAHDALVTKGFYGHEWLAQFKGTDLFNEAVKLCEEEIALEEESLKRRLVQAKRRKAAEAQLKATDDTGWDDTYRAQDQLRLRKDKLQIRLAKVQQKVMTGEKAK